MFKAFNKIRAKALGAGKFGRYLSYAIGEIILVVVGILIALQVNSWNESRKNKDTERKYLEAILEDIHLDLEHNDGVVTNSTHNLTAMNNVRVAITSVTPFEDLVFETFPLSSDNDTINFITSIGRCGFMILHQYYRSTFDDMKSAGKTSLISDPELKKAIFEYYQTMERLDDWTDIKRADHQRMTLILSEVLPYEFRLWANTQLEEKDSNWRANKPDPEIIRKALKEHPNFEAALEGVIFTANRLVIERTWRDGEAHRLAEKLEAAISQMD